jgi:formylglycine-generating enzyme required for sulfatase activity
MGYAARAMQRKAALSGAAIAAAALTHACFPDYGLVAADAGASDAPADTTQPPPPDGAAGSDGSSDDGAGAEAAPPSDAGDAGDATPPAQMVLVPAPGGPFDFAPGADAGDPWERVSLTHSFYLDKYEVTVDRLSAWVDAGMPLPCDSTTAGPDGTCALDATGAYPQIRWRIAWNKDAQANTFSAGCTAPTPGMATFPRVDGGGDFPANCVTWVEAAAFCAWDDHKRLPTHVEWTYEARGGDHRRYVWGDHGPDCSYATFAFNNGNCNFPVRVGTASLGVSVHGAYDLNGSVWEWAWDATTTGAIAVPAGSVDYAGDPSADEGTRSLIGASWFEGASTMDLLGPAPAGPGIAWGAGSVLSTTGLRCAKTAP